MNSGPNDATRLPRLLLQARGEGTMTLAEHLQLRGELATSDPHAIVEAIADAGLRGRGGAAFPTAEKMRAVIANRSRVGGRPIVVVNGAEGEPVSVKDRFLLERVPHLVLDGAALVARGVGARRVIVTVPDGDDGRRAQRAVGQAVTERAQHRPDGASVEVVSVPDRFVTGEESALVQALNGGPAVPTFIPPRPFERGVERRPTLVSNVETLAHVALIIRHGPAWFRALGTAGHPGSLLATVSGAVERPGVWEIESGTPLGALLGERSGSPRAVLVGGYFGSWVSGDIAMETGLDNESLAHAGASVGAGAVVALGADACSVSEVARVLGYLAGESTGQCGPCVHGLAAIAAKARAIADGSADLHAVNQLTAWGADIAGRGACRHPDGAVRFLSSSLRVFAAEFDDHMRHGPCDACLAPPSLPIGPTPALTR
ncbi:MAG: NADH-ubiquinone oxidoreductase-F iron-sulfur binding region domain-containing protein [Solirubrobacteraceae bacterium]|nr:MAG: proton-conducting membrane transporter [Solirubrobacterales bacterium]